MKYKYMEKQVEGAKALAEKYPHMQTHQDIYQEHVEVLEKAKAFDKLVELYPQKEEIPSDEFFVLMGYIIKERADDER
ncbi:hypothetical protein [Staphylococcus simulans]|uniref:hypothetical protein n=1 Tax=Staphylococcus simulans TaxID=1286 RepID=UPI000E692C75|nr:hypothetical protein [Staphylococcus simulans]RIN44405.1 hypothetical protein BU049_11215 [Staphylococcus simulans]RIN71012.1 hypothetical protein BU017_07655 [Staphylococcus simulans]